MPLTTISSLPYPDGGDSPNVPLYIQDLAQALDTLLHQPGDLKTTAVFNPSNTASWLLCDGTSFLRADYPALFAALGGTSSPHGLPDGTHFKVPDYRGRVIVMADGSAGRLSANDALGQSGGEEKHTLTIAELASHNHTVPFTIGVAGTPGSGGDRSVTDAFQVASSSTGGNNPHNNMQPYAVANVLIKT